MGVGVAREASPGFVELGVTAISGGRLICWIAGEATSPTIKPAEQATPRRINAISAALIVIKTFDFIIFS
jgi:hypothetical protein